MAKQIKPASTGTVDSRTFSKDLVEDIGNFGLPPNSWTQARNAMPNTVVGDIGDLSNEPANLHCSGAPYQIIGTIHLEADRWVIFSTDNTNSEIGLFRDDLCTYVTLVNDPCLNLHAHNLIKGQAKESFDCSWQIYWDDGRNPTRTLNIDNIPWIKTCTDENGVILPGPPAYVPVGCITCVNTTQLDCDAIRLAPLVKNACFQVKRGASGGEMLNGSYYVVAAYTVNQQRFTDYSLPSNVQALFSHSNVAGSIDIFVENMDDNFDEFELIIVSIRNQQTVAKRVGIYSTRQKQITLDTIDDRWPSIGLDLIPLRNPVYEKSDAIFRNGEYLLRTGPTEKFDFNYQPLANQIRSKWVSVEYPTDYYRKGGNRTGHMRDELYAYFIRFVYNTGDKSASYHIPGRAALASDITIVAGADAAIEVSEGLTPFRWRVYNTATVTSVATSSLPDGGLVVAEGDMAYWESTEKYDDDRPEIWNASSNPIWGSNNPAHDLCGKPIRHHKFPDNATDPSANILTNHFNQGGSRIRVMAVKFENIQPPLDNNGIPIPGVVGYEILRGTREGNKSVIAKGIINNMRQYAIEGGITPRTGLFPNYPYNDLRADTLLSTQETNFQSIPCDDAATYIPQTLYSQRHFTFHSPDTMFKDPFLSAKELKSYGEFNGFTEGQFIAPDKHPKNKLITDLAFLVGVVGGIGLAAVAMYGERKTRYYGPRTMNLGGVWAGTTVGAQPIDFGVSSNAAVATYYNAGVPAANAAITETGAPLLTAALTGAGLDLFYTTIQGTAAPVSLAPGTMGWGVDWETTEGSYRSIPGIIRLISAIPTFSYYFTQGVDETLRLLKAFAPNQQYALQYQSHCLYNGFRSPVLNNIRRPINEGIYLDPQIQDFGTNYRINNVYRSRTVALETGGAIFSDPLTIDNSRQSVGSAQNALLGPTFAKPDTPFNTTSSCFYTGMKQRLRNQYGQIEGIIQVPVTTCMNPITQTTTDVLFNGDIYIGRYTEKNTFFFFYDWLFDQPDGAVLNYKLFKMLPHPRYWMDTDPFDVNEFTNSVTSNLFNPAAWVFPNDKHNLDRNCGDFFLIKKAYMYLFHSGVRDFFVETEVNIDYRDWGNNDTERHYDPYGYTDLKSIFNSAIIKAGNFYKYDYSLSISRLFNNFISWGNVQQRNYDPQVAETCFIYRQNRVIYSLPQQLENQKDYWRVFLPNNYKDFRSRVTAVKPINKNGALFLFENESPVQFLGVDQLETDAGTKITIGDGGLFSQPVQNVLNTDDPYEYGSCQNRLSVINTASGIFYMSQNQGKIFQIMQGVKEISNMDIKWWLAEYLPYRITRDFPNFELTDNPVAGVGCQSIYDNENQLVYFCKKDYQLRKNSLDVVTYVSGDDFLVNGMLPIKLGDPAYFTPASWTISYDPKTESWISYHDWHPDLLIPGKRNFLSVKGSGIWRHNFRCDLYCNFYGIDFPFEVEFAVYTPQQVNTLRSIEYYMEAYRYDPNCYDRFHVLDFNFDEATIYNSEQCSGLLRLNLMPKNNPPLSLTYPAINPTFIDILFDKEEQKYRFNQFWDITADRGEFNAAAQRVIFNTESNGYIKNLNPNNLNYNKNQIERKKFRHFKNTVLLRRRVCGDRNMLVSIANNKNLYSPR